MQKIRLGFVYGGKSTEHEISILSALQAMAAADQDKYEVIPVYISKQGEWYTGAALRELEAYKKMDALLAKCQKVILSPNCGDGKLHGPAKGLFGKETEVTLDVVLPVIHGAHGEDGCLQGLLELTGLAYGGPHLLAAACGMDKIIMKAAFREAGIPVLPQVTCTARQWREQQEEIVAQVEQQLGYPVIVKPANLGSSIGINKGADRNSFVDAMDLAVTFSRRILIESCVENLREINCAVLGDADGAIASVCEEPVTSHDILTYGDKYLSGGKTKGMGGSSRQIPADLPAQTAADIKELALKAFYAIDGTGVSRVDFIMDRLTEQVYVNEINTIPGSLSFYLWEQEGIDFSQLIDRLVDLALKGERDKNSLTFSFEGNILAAGGLKGGIKGGLKK